MLFLYFIVVGWCFGVVGFFIFGVVCVVVNLC